MDWEIIHKDRDTITERMEVPGGHIYHRLVDGTAVGKDILCSSMVFIPDQDRIIRDQTNEEEIDVTVPAKVPSAGAPPGSILTDCGKDGWQWKMSENGYEGHICAKRNEHE